MNISIIAAVSQNGVFGLANDNKLPWKNHYPEDMKNFKNMTIGNTIIMGSRTFESIKKPLPNRRNIVISRYASKYDNVEVMPCLEDAISSCKNDKEIFLIGGMNIFREGLQNKATRIYLTIIPEIIEREDAIMFPWIDPTKFGIESTKPLSSNLTMVTYSKTL